MRSSAAGTERATTRLEEAQLLIQQLRYETVMLRRALDRIAVGVVLMKPDGNVIAANRKAREILAQKSETLSGSAAGSRQPTVRRVIDTIVESDDGSPVTRTIEVGEEPTERIHIFVAPLGNADSSDRSPKIIFLCNPSRPLAATENLLRELYQFTAAEAKLVLELINGKSVDEASERLHITSNTARSHLKKIFSKTQTKKQGEIVRLVTSALAALDLS